MTTTQTGTTILCESCEDDTATNGVWAQHFDPDDDGTGRSTGWSRSQFFQLCTSCLQEWHDDDQVGISEDYSL